MLTSFTAKPVSKHRAVLGESPIWDGAVLRWVDISGGKLFTLTPDRQSTATDLSVPVTAIALGPDAALLAATRTGLGWLDEDSGNVEQRLDVLSDGTMTMNDGCVDMRGRFWVGSATLDKTARGALYRLVDGTLHVAATGIMMSNGIDWSPDGQTLYHCDSDAGTIRAWDFDPDSGALGDSRIFRRIPPGVGLPDGLTVDSAGQVWVALWGAGEVWGLNGRTGRRVAVVSVPTPLVTSCAFGTPLLDTLYITTAKQPRDPRSGLLYAARLNLTGIAAHRFGGRL